MKIIKNKFIKDEEELKNKINQLDKIANLYLLKIEELYMEDLYFMSVIDKSIKLIDSFLFAMDKRNITVLATLARVQIDCVIRAFATTLVKDSGEFCKNVLIDKKRIDTITDINGNKLKDCYLCELLGEYLKLPVYDLYKKVCSFVHFSSDSFNNIAKASGEYDIEMFISRKNRVEDEKEFERLSIELANQFLFFGLILIEDIFASWLQQKEQWKKDESK